MLETLLRMTSSQKVGRPMGHPGRENPWHVTGMSEGSGEREASSSSGMKRSDLLRLRLRPSAGPSRSMMLRAAASWSGEPIRVPSSRYQEFKVRPGTCSWICLTMGWRVKAKPRGPS